MHRTVAAALVVALALALASCGGAGKPLTRAQLVRQIEVACRQGITEMQRVARGHRGSEGLINGLAVGQRYVIDRIGGLHAPSATKSDFEVLKQTMQQRLDLIARVQSAGRGARLDNVIRSVQAQAEALTRRVHAAATRLGVAGGANTSGSGCI
jgi:hypothetical protein